MTSYSLVFSAYRRYQEPVVRRLFLFILPTPYTPHPTPHTPHPTPHNTPHPTPHTPTCHFGLGTSLIIG
ncbi:hypothetical protein [Microcystis aeruginosa]|uniref:Uncharacterized protein n=1 Tax=Microcystis aeruginosa FD4 TaxID=2686288 RepID=A0A857D450_MICAE|nr:hypothetical protein [Microcystis aeruginosa]QGZ90437.1 hypothetical protein GQR42_13710 [Microcystis aeruginosa FD4]